jgi:CRP/FNR family transcriptional regulator, cyclic AMP receptor protein
MSIIELLQRSELFIGLDAEQIEQIADLSYEEAHDANEIIISEGEPSDEMYIISQGLVEVLISSGMIPDVPGPPQLTSLVRLGRGQFFGEMALVDRGARSATVRCVKDDTILRVIPRQAFWELCDNNHHIGYVVMRNIASDLSFKIRHRNIQTRLKGSGGAL